MVSTEVTKHSPFSAHQMQEMQMLLGGRSLTGTGRKLALSVEPVWDRRNMTIRRRLLHSSCVQFSPMLSSLPLIFKMALCEYKETWLYGVEAPPLVMVLVRTSCGVPLPLEEGIGSGVKLDLPPITGCSNPGLRPVLPNVPGKPVHPCAERRW
jgi:hypothetical protein